MLLGTPQQVYEEGGKKFLTYSFSRTVPAEQGSTGNTKSCQTPLKLRKVSLSDQPGKVTPAKDSPAKTGSPSRLRAVLFMGAQHERGLGGKSPQGVLTIAYFERLGVPRLS